MPYLRPSDLAGFGAESETEVDGGTGIDPRNLLRRGAVEGHAEAEFVGVDGRRFRARWEVRRARGKATGNFQKASWILRRTDGGEETPIADGPTEVEVQVAAALGLSFEQFRKAVLLAQGDFAAFLRAKEKERAERDAALLADDRTGADRQRAEEERSRTQRDGQVWLSLRSLIGEASGGKFRKFAQGLTLEALVRSANQHLADFARRYRLMQAPGTEVGLLVVDCGMGDEVRSVNATKLDRLALHRRGIRLSRLRHSRSSGHGSRCPPGERTTHRRHLARPGSGREDRRPGEGRRPRGRPERGAGRECVAEPLSRPDATRANLRSA